MQNILQYIRSDNGKIFKENAIKQHANNELFKGLLQRTYSPLIRFGVSVAQIPPYETTGQCMGLEKAFEEIDRLSSREFTGNAAKTHLAQVLSNLSLDNQEIIKFMLNGSLKLGCNVSTINKSLGKGFIKDASYMGAVSFAQKKVDALFAKKGGTFFSQLKADGRYTNVILDSKLIMESRQGLQTVFGSTFENLLDFERLHNAPLCLNGEIMVRGYERDRKKGNGIVSSMASIGEKIVNGEDVEKEFAKFTKKFGVVYEEMLDKLYIVVWDYIPIETYISAEKWATPYKERFTNLQNWIDELNLTNVELVSTITVKNEEEARQHFFEVISTGLEGTILKSADAGWQDGKPTFQIKYKVEMELDLEVVSGNYGNKGTKNETVISSLNVKTACGQLKTSPDGMSEDLMQWVTENIESLKGTVVKVKCNGLSKSDVKEDWSLMYPKVLEFRTDKTQADTLEVCQSIQEAKTALTA